MDSALLVLASITTSRLLVVSDDRWSFFLTERFILTVVVVTNSSYSCGGPAVARSVVSFLFGLL